MTQTPMLPARPKKAEAAFTSSLGVGLTSKNEFEENGRRSGHVMAPGAHWPPGETLVFGVMFPEGLPSPLPLPTHLTRCWPIAPSGIKCLPVLRTPSQAVSPLRDQHAGTASTENSAQ